MNTTTDAVALLGDVVDLAQEIFCRPLGDFDKRRQRCEQLEDKLETAIASGGSLGGRFLDNFAPILLQAVARAQLKRLAGDERGAAQWETLIGGLIPQVRADGARALSWLAEISQSDRPTR